MKYGCQQQVAVAIDQFNSDNKLSRATGGHPRHQSARPTNSPHVKAIHIDSVTQRESSHPPNTICPPTPALEET